MEDDLIAPVSARFSLATAYEDLPFSEGHQRPRHKAVRAADRGDALLGAVACCRSPDTVAATRSHR